MKKTSLSMRVLAMLLVIIMTVQILPLNALGLAFGLLQSTDTGVDLDTVNQKDAINWPIKIYDYLDDGMLFEWNDSTHTGDFPTGNDSTTKNTVPYGGGANPPVTTLGYDFTYGTSLGWSTSNNYSPWYFYNNTNYYYGRSYAISQVDAKDFQTPMHMHITDGSQNAHNFCAGAFSSAQSTTGKGRYMVMVYRAQKVQDYYFTVSVSDTTGGSGWVRHKMTMPDSSQWRYLIVDMNTVSASDNYSYVWLTWHPTAAASSGGMVSGAYVDFSHIGYFGNKAEAENYGKACVEFDNNPGEYLRHSSGNFTATTTTVTPSVNLRSTYLFSLNYHWKTAGSNPIMGDGESTKVHYGMDFTSTSKTEGNFTNAYTTNSYWTWANGSPQTYSYTDSNTNKTNSYTFNMDPIGVEQRSESNGAMYVRLTSTGKNKILLSKFREDTADSSAVTKGLWVPPTSAVNYLVLVYRANGLDSNDNYGLWAQGYDESMADYTKETVSRWKYAGLVADGTDWTTSNKVNKLSFNADAGWQYAVIPLDSTIGEKDSMMSYITRICRTGLYLPQMDAGESLDLAYVSYFSNSTEAATFGGAAVNYMNSSPKVTTSSTTKSYGSSRVWKTGNNKGFGMLYSTGGGNWPTTTATITNTATGTHTIAGGSNSKDAYGYDTWMIGYNTQVYSNVDFNTNRRDPITGQKYTANYTTTSDLTIQTPGADKTTNKIYFLSAASSVDGNSTAGFDTSVLDFDGYQLLERLTSGIMTAGLLEGSLRTVRVDNVDYRVPVYRQETVEYIAYLLLHSLRIPQKDSSGNYNQNFVAGSKSSQFGGVDLNGDGKIGKINLDGDSRNGNECDEASVDLATALRQCLGISLPIGANVGTGGEMGSYAETLKKDEMLLGKFGDCRYSIKTAMDAAYYMLNSLFIANSFNQKQDDYYYLNMPMAEVTTNNHSGEAYVFDASFTTGKTTTVGNTFSDDGTNKNAVVYSPVIDANGKAGTGTISLAVDANGNSLITGKTRFNFSTTGGTSWTTRFPFLPVTDAEGDYAGGTKSYYFWNDDIRTYYPDTNSYINRNYNYVLASNGEFVYKENDKLFFEFEGDDDVYLFINGELVLDIGAGHSITSVYIDVNDYVNKAREVMKDLTKYGYTNDMVIEKFDDMISAPTLEEYIYDSNGKITGTKTVDNPFTQEQIDNYKRWARLDLVDGQICQFDFYYMERHGWGANMRIVTNMHITDPSLDVDKTAYQYGQEIEYGGVIDPTASLEYNFALTNSGNQKLYNLTFKDDVIGVTLDPTNGLTVNGDKNGIYILDGNGHALEAKDLTATVSGYNVIGQYTEIPITFPEVDGDGGQTALKNFLKTLSAEGTDSGYDDAEITHAGSGLWVDATVTIKGIHYMLTPDQIETGAVHNTVYLTATTRIDPNTVGNQTLKSDAEHLIYTSGFPVHYQWAGHNIFIKMEHLLEEAKKEADTEGTQLNLYNKFFNSVSKLSDIHYNLCDKYGRTGGYYAYHTKTSDNAGNPGYLVNYDEPGIYTFYLLLYKKQGANKYYAENGVDAEDIAEGEYAIIRSQVYVADVEDSIFVLDYGLSTESLDIDGELFSKDHLFGPYGTIRAKLMGVTGQQPSYLDPATTNGTDYCRIAFQSQNLSASNTITTPDGIYKVNLAIPGSGKLISYDSATGKYTLTGVGTVTIKAVVPTDSNWKQPYLYYWYDDGTSGPAWPGTPMKELGAGQYEIDIPADVSNVIVNNGSGALQTKDLKLTPGLESTIYVTVSNTNEVSTRIETIMEEVTIHVKAPADWEKVYLHHWHDDGESTEYPGKEITEKDENGYWTIKVHGDVTHMLVNDGGLNQSGDLNVYAGKEAWIEVSDDVSGTFEGDDGKVTTYYSTSVKYTLSEGFKVHASVPNGWGDTVYLYYWRTDGSQNAEWPGAPMTKGDFGWYTSAEDVPADVSQIIINDGTHQTVDLAVTPGLETWIMVNNSTTEQAGMQKYTAKVAYGSETSAAGLTFTPTDFMDQANNLWLAITVHSTNSNPTVLNSLVDIHNETQMYKKISVIPATVVYYEDTFGGVDYNNKTTGNSFTHHGNGSGQLSQSIDQKQPYGQDAAYQSGENDLYSGDSLTEVEIMTEDVVATFDFKGTGFEIIGRTNALDGASFMARVYKKADYSADAYAKYMVAAQSYLEETTKIINVENAYADAVTAYNKAVQLRDAALAAPEDEAAQKAYEQALATYNAKRNAYQSALQAHTPKDTDYVICGEFEVGATLVAPGVLVDMTYPALPESPFVTINMVYTQFDHGNNGGAEGINQVPVVRVTDLELGEYVVEVAGLPMFIFDENNNYEVIGTQPTNLYLDGYRIFQPLGPTHDAYIEPEDNATIEELRDMIAQGIVGVGVLEGSSLSVSSGTTTWTESLNDNDFDASNKETYHSIKVGSTADYLIQGPNNEVYMEGNATNSALIFYVKEADGATVHELQIAARALDYGRYYGAGSTALNVQLQYGILTENGYAWKNLVRVVSGTEQYYSIPYEECPLDTQGRYQIVLRAINPQTNSNAMVSYTNVKLNGLTVEKVDGVGEGSVIHYQNGILVKPEYELIIVEDASFAAKEIIPFIGSELTTTLSREWTYVFIRSTLSGEVYEFYSHEDPGQSTTATMWRYDDQYGDYSRWTLDINGEIGKEITFKIKQPSTQKLELSYCIHSYGEGVLTREPNCTNKGVMAYTCTKCGHIKNEYIDTNGEHNYSGGVCIYCGKGEAKYYLVGYINGKNVGSDNDYQNMGPYLFVDGKLTVKFEKDSYVYVKADGNKAWYMTESYVTDNTAVMGNTASGNYTEKMYVPCGVELVFTLTHNPDGTKTLHYEEPCKHSWGEGVVTKAADCLENGEKTFTCSLCFETKTEMIPATGHNYVGGICSNSGCGDILYRDIYFQNTAGWENVYVYAWVDGGTEYTSKWPGDAMEHVEGNIYKATLPAYLKVIFNNGTEQSDNLNIPEHEDMYVWSTKTWMNHSGEVDYYLVGNINGVDYGFGDNANNMGIYKFVDGKLKVSFTKESYVFVKTTGNATWYMAETYCDTYSATLYDTTTGANEKMFIPGGTEIEFTLTVNDDGTVNLVAHSWGSVVTKEPDCTTEGERTYTCYLCNDTYKEAIPANGHNYVDDVCTVCGNIDTRIVYFHNTAGWENVYIYAFTEGTPATEYTGVWPGAQMSLVEGETDLYYYVLSAQAKSVIFNNGSGGAGNQTDNLHAPTDENNKYTFGANVWSPVDEEVELPEAEKLYLDPNDNWVQGDAWFAAYFFGNGETWVKMTDEDGDGIYECEKPEGYPNVIFCRMNPEATALSWDSKWDQTVDLTIPTDGSNCFTVAAGDWNNANGTWSAYTCAHSYTEEITTEPDCNTAGVKTYTCSKCGDSYTEEIASNGHDYVDGSCTVCGGKDPEFVDNIYLQPGASWQDSGAWFAAWFPGAETWVTLTDFHGNGYYQCEIPEGATGVIFVRMNPEATAPSWNDGEKWNQSVDLSIEANRVFVIENPWNESFEWKATGSWTDYDATVAECQHSYETEVITAVSCTADGENRLTCSKCGNTYTETVKATGHNFQNGTCANGCGTAEPTEPVVLYLKPNANWKDGDTWFAAYFFGNGDTWVQMTDEDGDGIYECVAPNGYPNVIFCRMNPDSTELGWDSKWDQTNDLTVPVDANVCYTVAEGAWSKGDGEWGPMTTSYSLRMTRSLTKAMSAETASNDIIVGGDEDNALNLYAIKEQMSSDVIYGQTDYFVPENTEPEYEDLKINGAALVLSDDIDINYYVTVPAGAENVYMTFTMNGETTVVTDYTVGANGRYSFVFSGINAQKMGDNVSATVYATVDGNEISESVEQYSVRDYCVNQLNKLADDAELVRLISDLLVYGEKNQIYQGYKTDKLVTEGLELSPSTFNKLDDSFDKFTVTGTADASARFTGVGLVLSNKVVMSLVIKTDDPAAFTYRVNVAGVDTDYTAADLEDAGDGKYVLYFDELKATAFDQTVTVTMLRDGQTVGQTVTYSVNSYIYRNQNTDDVALRDLLEAIYNYGLSAQEYVG